MPSPELLPWLFVLTGLVFPLFVFAIIAVVISRAIRGGRSNLRPLPLDPHAPVLLQGRLTRSGDDTSAAGTVSLDAQYFSWQPGTGQPWRTPITGITVLSSTAAGMSAPQVDLAIEGSGAWSLVVSDQPITRVGSDAKRFREAMRGAEFRDRLLAAGARRA